MDGVILASASGKEERVLNCEYDFEIGGNNDFELSIPASEWLGDIAFKKRIYIPGTEYGGIVKCIESDTEKETVFVRGYTWRGYLYNRFVNGTISGELNSIIASMIGPHGGVIIASSDNTGITTAYTTHGYESAGDILTTIMKQVGFRISLTYVQTQDGGHVLAKAVKAKIYDEISQDSPINFMVKDDRMGVNHLIVTDDEQTIHLYADEAGNISQTQTQVGMDEVVDLFNATGDLIETGTEELRKYISGQSINVDFTSPDDIDYNVGDSITGRDYITGITATKAITSKILTCKDGEITVEYSIEELD